MSTHPNVILYAVVTVDGTARKTMRSILDEAGCGEGDEIDVITGKRRVSLGDKVLLAVVPLVMEEDYDEGWQIGAKEGCLVFHDLVTYGYGESLSWDELSAKKEALEAWCRGICERHKCTFEIRVSANYW